MRNVRPVAIALAAFLLACGGEGEGLNENVEETVDELQEAAGVDTLREGEEAAAPERVTVEATSFAYDPSRIEVAPGRVRFVIHNAADIVHGFEVEGHGMEEAIEHIAPGGTDSLTVDLAEPGTYEIYCPVGDHQQRGMTATLVVGGTGS